MDIIIPCFSFLPHPPHFQHEEASVDMFEYMVDVNRLKPVFEKYGLIEEDRVCIEELILGQPRTRRAERAEVMGNYEIYCNFQI